MLGTCHGQVHVLSLNLKPINVIDAHSGMVTLLHVDGNEVYSVGDEGVLKVWKFKSNNFVEKVRKEYGQRPNLLFSVEGRGYVNFYESTKYEEIL